MRPERETTAQQLRDLVKLVSQLRSEIPSLLPVPNPPATLADCDSLSIITPLTATHPHTALVIPLPKPPVVPTGEPVHYDSITRPRRHTIKLENYAGQGASLEAFLAKYEEHSRYYEWNDDDRVFHIKNCLTGTAATVLWASGIHATATQLIAFLMNQH